MGATLGAWQPAASKVQLFKDEEGSPWWRGRSAFPLDAEIEFKFAIIFGDGAVRWEDEIGNRKIQTQPGTMLLGAHFDCQDFIQKEFVAARNPSAELAHEDGSLPLDNGSLGTKLEPESSAWLSRVLGS